MHGKRNVTWPCTVQGERNAQEKNAPCIAQGKARHRKCKKETRRKKTRHASPREKRDIENAKKKRAANKCLYTCSFLVSSNLDRIVQGETSITRSNSKQSMLKGVGPLFTAMLVYKLGINIYV
jgi:hypothetical protein